MPHLEYFNRPSLLKDTFVLLIVNLFLLLLFINFDVLEWAYQFSRQHEAWELDEIIPLGVSLAISLVIFSYRRIVELGELTHTFERLSMRDPLTNLLNRRAGQVKLISYQQKAKANNNNYLLIQMDLDQFSKVNRLYGTNIGDEILIATARFLEQSLPETSLIIRWLDDKFLILLPYISEESFELPHKLCTRFDGQLLGRSYPVTCSIGISVWSVGEDLDDALYNVEEALIGAKQAGGNRVNSINTGKTA
ncbi:GGDEF domain-containing protein [Shewanella violacea]|nr:GGDEF domain-containing protein [Shewanella violacea]